MCPPISATGSLPLTVPDWGLTPTRFPRLTMTVTASELDCCKVLYAQGCHYQAAGDRRSAIEVFRRLLDLTSGWPHQGLQRAAHWALQSLQADLKQGPELPPGPPPTAAPVDAWLSLATELQTQQAWQAAHQAYQQGLRLAVAITSPLDISRCLHGMGLVALAQQQWQRAETYCRSAFHILAEVPESPESEAVILHHWGVAHYEQGHITAALRCFQQALDRWQVGADTLGVALTLLYLGRLYARQQKYWFALGSLAAAADVLTELALEADVREAIAVLLEEMANLHEQTGHPELAIAYLQEALYLYQVLSAAGNQVIVRYHLGRLYQTLGQARLARHYYQQLAQWPQMSCPLPQDATV